ncbi:MAG: glycosyltransferase family 39 protein [Chloroflexi bacterium]|nr:glycosyltransferase family 39 protein [Chloroflexota bacterium]
MDVILLNGGYLFFLLVLFSGLLVLLIIQGKRLISRFTTIPAWVWGVLFLITIGGGYLRFSAPHALQIYFDEFYYISTGENMARNGHASYFWENTPEGKIKSCPYFYPPYPPGWSFLLSMWDHVFPPGLPGARILNILLSTLTIPVLFLSIFLLWKKAVPALCGAVFLAVLPVAVKLAPSAAPEVGSFFFLVLALLCALNLRESEGMPLGARLLSIAAFGMYLQMRPENLLLAPFYAAALWKKHTRIDLFILFLLAVPVLSVFASAIYITRLSENFASVPRPGISGELSQFMFNLKNNLLFFVSKKHPVIMDIFFMGGLILGLAPGLLPPDKEEGGTDAGLKKKTIFILIWGGAFLIFFSMFPFGDFSARLSFDSWRTSLAVYLPFILLSSLGTLAVMRLPMGRSSLSFLMLFILLTPLFYSGFIKAKHPQETFYNSLIRKARSFSKKSVFVTDNTDLALALKYETENRSLYDVPRGTLIPDEPNYYLITPDLNFDRWEGYEASVAGQVDVSGQKLFYFKLNSPVKKPVKETGLKVKAGRPEIK